MFMGNVRRSAVLCLLVGAICASEFQARDQRIRLIRHASCPSCRRERPDALVSWDKPPEREYRDLEAESGTWQANQPFRTPASFSPSPYSYPYNGPYNRATRSRGTPSIARPGGARERENPFTIGRDFDFNVAAAQTAPVHSLSDSIPPYQPRLPVPGSPNRSPYDRKLSFYDLVTGEPDVTPVGRYADYNSGSPFDSARRDAMGAYGTPGKDSKVIYASDRFYDDDFVQGNPMMQPEQHHMGKTGKQVAFRNEVQPGRQFPYGTEQQAGRKIPYGNEYQLGKQIPYGNVQQPSKQMSYGIGHQFNQQIPYGNVQQSSRQIPYESAQQPSRQYSYGNEQQPSKQSPHENEQHFNRPAPYKTNSQFSTVTGLTTGVAKTQERNRFSYPQRNQAAEARTIYRPEVKQSSHNLAPNLNAFKKMQDVAREEAEGGNGTSWQEQFEQQGGQEPTGSWIFKIGNGDQKGTTMIVEKATDEQIDDLDSEEEEQQEEEKGKRDAMDGSTDPRDNPESSEEQIKPAVHIETEHAVKLATKPIMMP